MNNEHIINSGHSSNAGRGLRPNLQSGYPSNRTTTTADIRSSARNTTSSKRTRKEKLEDAIIISVSGSGFLYGIWLTILNLL